MVKLEEKVDLVNRFNIGAGLITPLFPFGIKKFLKDNACRDELIKLFSNLALETLKVGAGNEFKWNEFMDQIHDDIYAVVKPCVQSVKYSYMDKIKAFTAPFNKFKEGSELGLLIRDYIISDIYGTEKRNFYDGYSFGGLTYTNISAEGGISSKTKFSGPKDSEHIYNALVSEDIFEYGIESDIIFKSTIDPRTSQKGAIGLPFEVIVISGDAKLKENSTLLVGTNGKLTMTFIMGEEDSEIEIKPLFNNSGITTDIISLKPECLSPSITDVSVVCPENGSSSLTYEVFLSFDTGITEGLNASPNYEIGLEFQQFGTGEDWQYAYNSFSSKLYSGDKYKGVYKISIPKSGTFFCSPRGTRTTLRNWHNFRVYISNSNCDYKSEYEYFETTFY
jgi:hypothetical protein